MGGLLFQHGLSGGEDVVGVQTGLLEDGPELGILVFELGEGLGLLGEGASKRVEGVGRAGRFGRGSRRRWIAGGPRGGRGGRVLAMGTVAPGGGGHAVGVGEFVEGGGGGLLGEDGLDDLLAEEAGEELLGILGVGDGELGEALEAGGVSQASGVAVEGGVADVEIGEAELGEGVLQGGGRVVDQGAVELLASGRGQLFEEGRGDFAVWKDG